jgi:hypothetical protein
MGVKLRSVNERLDGGSEVVGVEPDIVAEDSVG